MIPRLLDIPLILGGAIVATVAAVPAAVALALAQQWYDRQTATVRWPHVPFEADDAAVDHHL